jgi:uncharacterized protein (TIRG00374 family)
MSPRVRQVLQYSISLMLAVALLWYVMHSIHPSELLARFQQADYRWIILSGLLSVVAYWSRAKRWCLLIEPLGYRPRVFHSFIALMSGYFVNMFLPRVGEVTRCGVLNKLEKVPVNVSFGTVVAERIFDVIMLFILLCFTFLLEFGRLGGFLTELLQSRFTFVSEKLKDTPTVLALIITALLFAVTIAYMLFRYRHRLAKIRLVQKIAEFLEGMGEGLVSVRKLKNPTAFFFHTGLIWVMYYLMSYVLFFAMPQTADLGIRAGFTILIMGGLGMSAPVQGGFGTFHILVGNALVLYGLSQQDGLILATFMHTSQTLFTLLMGGICLLIGLFIQRKKPLEEVKSVM